MHLWGIRSFFEENRQLVIFEVPTVLKQTNLLVLTTLNISSKFFFENRKSIQRGESNEGCQPWQIQEGFVQNIFLGGFTYFLNFHPKPGGGGGNFQFDLRIFFRWVVQPRSIQGLMMV